MSHTMDEPSALESDAALEPHVLAAQDLLQDLQERLLAVARDRPALTLITAAFSGFILGKLVSRI